MPYDPETTVGEVRLLISDVGGADGESFIFTDDEIQTFLNLRLGRVPLAAAMALNAIAANEAQVSKRIKYLELETDGPSVARELRALAAQYASDGHEIAGVKVGKTLEGE